MEKIIVYGTSLCPYCLMAKRLLKNKGVPFEEINLNSEPGRRAEMLERSGGRHTVPQIFIGQRHIGGFDELYSLEQDGKLDALIESAA